MSNESNELLNKLVDLSFIIVPAFFLVMVFVFLEKQKYKNINKNK